MEKNRFALQTFNAYWTKDSDTDMQIRDAHPASHSSPSLTLTGEFHTWHSITCGGRNAVWSHIQLKPHRASPLVTETCPGYFRCRWLVQTSEWRCPAVRGKGVEMWTRRSPSVEAEGELSIWCQRWKTQCVCLYCVCQLLDSGSGSQTIFSSSHKY